MAIENTGAVIDTGRSFMSGSSGKWAGERFIAAMNQGRDISPSELRTNEVLRNEEWVVFDQEIIIGYRQRIRAVADLIAAGLVKRIANGLAKTVFVYDKLGDLDPAIVSLDGVTRSENDRMEFQSAGLPLPITHKDFYLNLRTLRASRLGTEPLDTTYMRVAGRKVAELTEDMLFNGSKSFGGLPIYGLLTHPNRNIVGFGTNGNWGQAAKVGEDILVDIFAGITKLETGGFFGPYWLFVGGTAASLKLAEDFKDTGDKTIRERILDLDQISRITVVDKLPPGNIVLFQPTSDVVEMLEGEPLQTVQWDTHGGFQTEFKAFQIMVPLVRSNADNNSGIVHFS
jgi:uncharacterized linocin/CFP29 family protein